MPFFFVMESVIQAETHPELTSQLSTTEPQLPEGIQQSHNASTTTTDLDPVPVELQTHDEEMKTAETTSLPETEPLPEVLSHSNSVSRPDQPTQPDQEILHPQTEIDPNTKSDQTSTLEPQKPSGTSSDSSSSSSEDDSSSTSESSILSDLEDGGDDEPMKVPSGYVKSKNEVVRLHLFLL